MTATPWTERTATQVTCFEGRPGPGSGNITGFALFGMPIPISHGLSFADSSVTYAERSLASGTYLSLEEIRFRQGMIRVLRQWVESQKLAA